MAADLALLDDALDDPEVNLGDLFQRLDAAVRSAIVSYCGLSITVVTNGYPVTLTSLAALGEGTLDAAAVTSLGIPLGVVTAAAIGEFVLFASTPGAFVDLAADLAYTTHTDAGVLALDIHLAQTAHDLPVGLAESSIVNQAIGALIERGFTPEPADAYLNGNAADTGRHVSRAAADILHAVIP